LEGPKLEFREKNFPKEWGFPRALNSKNCETVEGSSIKDPQFFGVPRGCVCGERLTGIRSFTKGINCCAWKRFLGKAKEKFGKFGIGPITANSLG